MAPFTQSTKRGEEPRRTFSEVCDMHKAYKHSLNGAVASSGDAYPELVQADMQKFMRQFQETMKFYEPAGYGSEIFFTCETALQATDLALWKQEMKKCIRRYLLDQGCPTERLKWSALPGAAGVVYQLLIVAITLPDI
jgi:hypothetical protein